MDVNFTSFDKVIGYNYNNREKPFYLLSPVIVIVSYAVTKRKYLKIQEDFTSDGCTLWRIFWLILGCPHKPEYLPASIIHDWVLEHPEIVNYNRKFSSQIFKTVLLKTGVNPVKAQMMYLAVEFWQSFTNIWRKKWKN